MTANGMLYFSLFVNLVPFFEDNNAGVSLRFCAGGQWGFLAGHF